MKCILSSACLVGCALCYSPMSGFFIVNSSDSPKNVEVIAYLPSSNGIGKTPQTVLKKELQPNDSVEAPFALREVVLDVHWGKEKTITTEGTTWKPLPTEPGAAITWQNIGTLGCGKEHRPCHAVIPPTWRLTEDHTGITVITDDGKTIHAVSQADLMTKIPYRRIADSFPQERIVETDQQSIRTDWKKIGMNYRKNEEIVIPRTWSIKEQGNENIITTHEGKEIRIPIKHVTRIDPATGKERLYTIANEYVIKKVIPYRRKDGVVKEFHPIERLFVVEESVEKPIKTTQYNLFRRFAASEAEPAPQARGVPQKLGTDHIFEIFGTEYDTDIAFMYVPDEEQPAIKRTKRVLSPETTTESPKKPRTEKTKQSRKRSFLQRNNNTNVIDGSEKEN